ncbi:hypothetical protein [Rhizobium sp.]|uniref:hypothetical protein n=1 Tax=Rhizobium sp. TaxID=391 RepID=UPI0034C5F1DB
MASTAFMVGVAYYGYYKEGSGGFLFFVGILIAVMSIILTPVFVVKAFDKRPAFDFSKEGVVIVDVSKERISWDDIVSAKVDVLQTTAYVKLQVREAAAKQLTTTWLAKINRPFYGRSTFFVTPAGTQLSADRLAELIGNRGTSDIAS